MVHWTHPKPDAPPDGALLSALNHPRDRAVVLGYEEVVRNFLQHPAGDNLTFASTKMTYQRLLAHKVAQHYQLKTASVDQGNGSMVVASFIDAHRPTLERITPLAELMLGTSAGEASEHASNDSRSVAESWTSEASAGTPQPHASSHSAGDAAAAGHTGRRVAGHAAQQQHRLHYQQRQPPQQHQYDQQQQRQQQHPHAATYAPPMSPSTSGGPYAAMAYPYPGAMPSYAVSSNGMYMPVLPPGAAGMAHYTMPMVPPGATAMYPAGYSPMPGYPQAVMGQDGQTVMYVMPQMPAMATGSAVQPHAQAQAYAQQQQQQQQQMHHSMAAVPHPLAPHMVTSPMAGILTPPVLSPHAGAHMPPLFVAAPHPHVHAARLGAGAGLQPSPTSRVSSPHLPMHATRVASPQSHVQHQRLSPVQVQPYPGGYFGAPVSPSILHQQHNKHKPFPSPPGVQLPHQQYEWHSQQPQHQQPFARGNIGSPSLGVRSSPGPAAGTIRAMKGELLRMHQSQGAGVQRSPPDSPQGALPPTSRVRKPTVVVGDAAGDEPLSHLAVGQQGEAAKGCEAEGLEVQPGSSKDSGRDSDPGQLEQPYSPGARRLSPASMPGADEHNRDGSVAVERLVMPLGSLSMSSRLRCTSTSNSAALGGGSSSDLPAGSPLPTPVAMLKAATSPMRLRQSSSGACSPSYGQVQHRVSNSGSATSRRFTVNGSVSACEPKREGAFGMRAAQAASAVAAAIILKPGLNGRSSPINLSIHCPPGMKRPPPESVLCPLSGKVMKDPVFLVASGLTYDRSSLEALMQDGKGTCPTTGTSFDASNIVPNQHAKQVVQDWLRHNPEPDGCTPGRDAGSYPGEGAAAEGCGSPLEDGPSGHGNQSSAEVPQAEGADLSSRQDQGLPAESELQTGAERQDDVPAQPAPLPTAEVLPAVSMTAAEGSSR